MSGMMSETFQQNLAYELGLGQLGILRQGVVPVVPGPAELEVGEVVGEPVDEPVEARHVHDADPLVQELGGLGQHLGHGAGLQLAQLDHDGAVGDLEVLRVWQPEDLTEHDLHDDVLQWDLVLERVGQQLGGALLPLPVVGRHDVGELLLDEPPLYTVLAGQDGTLRAVGVVEHPEDDGGERVESGGVVGGRHQAGDVVLQRLTQDAVECEVRSDDVFLNPHV